jgi:hypothetical protein
VLLAAYGFICRKSQVLNSQPRYRSRLDISRNRRDLTNFGSKDLVCNIDVASQMSSLLRSKQGCWTCRLRKKKCDERQPICSTCESLLITCYGFGPKPDWMSNGEEERAITNNLKEIVKHTARRKFQSQSSDQHKPMVRIAPMGVDILQKVSIVIFLRYLGILTLIRMKTQLNI